MAARSCFISGDANGISQERDGSRIRLRLHPHEMTFRAIILRQERPPKRTEGKPRRLHGPGLPFLRGRYRRPHRLFQDRKSVVWGRSESVTRDLGGRRILKRKKK